MKLFRKKTKNEMVESFLKKYSQPVDHRWGINMREDLYELIKYLKIPHLKYNVLIWGIPMFIIGISFLGALLDIGLLKIFVNEDLRYYQSFINIFINCFLFIITLALIIIPIYKIGKIL